MLISKHKDFVFLNKLSDEINKDIGNLNNGGCGVLARIMYELFGYKNFLYIIDDEELENDPPLHILTEIEPNIFFDCDGIYTLQFLKKSYFNQDRFYLLKDNEEILFSRYNELGDGIGVVDFKADYLKIKKYISNKFRFD